MAARKRIRRDPGDWVRGTGGGRLIHAPLASTAIKCSVGEPGGVTALGPLLLAAARPEHRRDHRQILAVFVAATIPLAVLVVEQRPLRRPLG
jgi:hypothetical protein